MIGSLRGRLLRKDANQVLVEVGGVGYLLHIPLSTFFYLPEVEAEVSLRVHTHVRDDAIQLFGFATDLDLSVFERLVSVTGIGPKLATTILSGIPTLDLVDAIRTGDVRRLTGVPGLGKKTSERLILELRDKFAGQPLPGVATKAPAGTMRDDAISALVNLGYRQRDAEAAVDGVQDTCPPELAALLKSALAVLAR